MLDWNVIAVDTVRAATPAKFQIEGQLYMTYVQAAVYDAVAAIKGKEDGKGKDTPFRKLKLSIPGASSRAAAASAAYSTLVYFFPAQAATLTSKYTDYLNVTLSSIPAESKQAGVAVGAAAAADLIASRWGDGRDAPISTPYGVGTAACGDVGVRARAVGTVGADAVGRVHEAVPARLGLAVPAAGTAGADELAVRHRPQRGEDDGRRPRARPGTADQTAIAQFWNANVINQYAPGAPRRRHRAQHGPRGHGPAAGDGDDGQHRRRDRVHGREVPLPPLAAGHRDPRRPTATDTADDWSPLLTTPNHPEYPSAHGCVTAATVAVLESVLKTKNINVDFPGATGGGTTLTTSRHFNTSDELIADVANARVWAGLHYRFSTTAGVELGKAVAKWDLDHFGKGGRRR